MEKKSNGKLLQGQVPHQFLCSFCVLVVATLLTGGSVVVEAVDVTFFDNTGACTGEGYTFPGLAERTCAEVTNEGSVQISGLSSGQTTIVDRGGGCTTQIFSGSGPTVYCVVGGAITGSFWFNNDGSVDSMTTSGKPTSSRTCTSTMPPHSILFTKDSSKGTWVLEGNNVHDLMAELRSVDDAEKVSWLKKHGAHFKPGSGAIGTIVDT